MKVIIIGGCGIKSFKSIIDAIENCKGETVLLKQTKTEFLSDLNDLNITNKYLLINNFKTTNYGFKNCKKRRRNKRSNKRN